MSDNLELDFLKSIQKPLRYSLATLGSYADFTNFNSELQLVLDHIRNFYDLKSGATNSVCIKWLMDRGTIRTLSRDSKSDKYRRFIDKDMPGYYLRDNTAFEAAVDGPGYYWSNNLECEEEYRNLNPRWRELYNAVVVVPIKPPSTYLLKQHICGFLCIDNKTGGFSNTDPLLLLLIAAELAFVFIEMETISAKLDSVH